MPRAKTKGELWRRLDYMYILRDQTTSPGDTTTDAAEPKGEVALSVADEANFAADDYIRVDSEDAMEVHQVLSTGVGLITTKTGLHNAKPSGTVVKELEQVDLGHLTDDGVTFTAPGDHNAVNIGTRTLAWAYLIGHTELAAEFSLASWNLENIATAFGIPDTSTYILGAGTTADPYRLVLDPEDYATELNVSFAFEGIRQDGAFMRFEMWGAEVDVTALNATLARATAATPLGMRARATSGVGIYLWS
jgi:hypothetical protein